MSLQLFDDFKVLTNGEVNRVLSECKGIDVRIVIDLDLVGNHGFNSPYHFYYKDYILVMALMHLFT